MQLKILHCILASSLLGVFAARIFTRPDLWFN